MYIPFIYILFIAEALLVFIIISIILGIAVYRLTGKPKPTLDYADEQHNINFGKSYTEHLDIEMMKNTAQIKIENRVEHDPGAPQISDSEKETRHSKLLKLRDSFLHAERASAEHADNDIHFWQSVYDGMNKVHAHFKTVQHELTVEAEQHIKPAKAVTEKVFYIETQGKKVDGEVNRLKDIIYDQENTLSDLLKALKHAEVEHKGTDNEPFIATLLAQLSNVERQLGDAKTCMEVLELENNRLQEELHKFDQIRTDRDLSRSDDNSKIDVQNMREMLKKQEQQISRLTSTIDTLQLSTEQSDSIKTTLSEFIHSSNEMMSCITILEEENERLQATSDHAMSDDTSALKTQIKKLQEEAIKKDVAYAKLQEEFASMESEYLAMYNAIHGDNS